MTSKPLQQFTTAALLALLAVPIHTMAQTTPTSMAPNGAAASAPVSEKLSAAEYEQRKANIIKLFEQRRARYRVVATTKTKSGQVIDWIDPQSQVGTGKLSAPPGKSVSTSAPKDGVINPFLKTPLPSNLGKRQNEKQASTELQLDPGARGPKGTVPIVRFDVETYLREVKDLPTDPLQILTKIAPPSPDSNNRYYAVWQRIGDVFGTLGRINIWDTTGPVGNETSIAQTAVIRGTPMQAIEAGKIETAGFTPTRQPVFFTYFRTAGAASGDWVGGYNTLVDGWIQVSSNVAPGMSLVPGASTTNGAQYSLDVEVRLWQGNWWVRAAGEWAGYYPNCIGGAAPPCTRGTLFSEAGIRDKANRLDWYGEVFDSRAPAATSTDMGSGAYANTHFGRSAYFRNLLYVWAPASAWWFDAGSISVTDATCYSADGPFYSADPNWRNWFYYGGPGDEGNGCN
jgi:hypothetical protein